MSIFKVLVEKRDVGLLTTLDIQAELEVRGIDLSKKEINAWLHNLQSAGLVSRGDERGKPTIVDYDDKYTFDMWRLTDLGFRIAVGLSKLMKKDPFVFGGDVVNKLEEIACTNSVVGVWSLMRLEELYLIMKTLLVLLESGGELQRSSLINRLLPKEDKLDMLLSRLTESREDQALLHRSLPQKSLKERLIGFFGLFKSERVYSLTERGRKLSEDLKSVKDTYL
jgi:hypothetical protein